jgi:hypothetical protein
MFRQAGAAPGFLLNPFHTERRPEDVDDRFRSPGKRLFEAILRNRLLDVKIILENGADPNVSLAIVRSHLVITREEQQDHKVPDLDNVFLWKKLFGESPTPVHIAVMNVYHCNHSHRDLEKALKILKLLLQHGGDVGHKSVNMFLQRKMIATNPLELALGVQRMTLWMNIEKAETAMIKAVEIMRQHYDPSKPIVRSRSVPFELVSLQLLDRVESLLFASHSTSSSDITFVSSDVEYPALDDDDDGKTSNKKTNGISDAKAMMVRV